MHNEDLPIWNVLETDMKDNYCPCTIGLAVLNYWRKYRTRPEAGLYKLLHPAIPDGRAWSNMGEHREPGEHGK